MALDFRVKYGFDLVGYVDLYKSFIQNDYPSIVAYYSGLMQNAAEPMRKLDELDRLAIELDNVIKVNRDRMNGIEYWDAMESIDTIKYTLTTVRNTGKWLRSSGGGAKHSTYSQDVVLRQGDTLETVARSRGRKPDDWASIAIDNDLREEDYSSDGGNVLKLQVPKELMSISDVVDFMDGDAMYGRDVQAKLELSVDDLVTLTPLETVAQSMNTMIRVRKGSIPEYPSLGATKSVGGNQNTLSLPTLFRSISAVFLTDDIVNGVQLVESNLDGDTVTMKILVSTKLNNDIIKSLVI